MSVSDQLSQETVVPAPTAKMVRLLPLDALRGLIIVVMALDHANLFIAEGHPPSEIWSRPLYKTSDTLAFLTRFITHLAAPGFFFLMGAGIALFAISSRQAGRSHFAISRHLAIRGVILIALQLLVENRAWSFNAPPETRDYFPVYFGVLYGLGAVMLVSAALIYLNSKILLGLSLVCVACFEIINPSATTSYAPPLRLLLIPGQSDNVQVLYPLIPWLGIALFGIIFGRWLAANPAQAYRRALWLGAAFLGLFLVLRTLGGFGNIRTVAGEGWIPFLNVVKYPPALVFILFTLGVDLLLLWLFARANRFLLPWAHPLVTFGRTPLFFYLAHLYLYAIIAGILGSRGTGIPAMYPYWLLGLVILYPLCWLYGKFKHSRPPNSLWRLF